MQCVAVWCSVFQCVAMCCSATHCDHVSGLGRGAGVMVTIRIHICHMVHDHHSHAAVCSRVLQCNTLSPRLPLLDAFVLQCVAVCCSVLQCVAVCCSVLQCVAVRCSVLQSVTVCCSVLQCVSVRCSVLQCVAVCRSVLQCFAMCCS